MRALAYDIAALNALPYAFLALAFILFGRATSAGSLFSFLKTLLDQATWLIPWGLLAIAFLSVVFVGLGVHPYSRKAGAIVRCVVASAATITISLLSAKRVGTPELTFLIPCIAAAVVGGWLAAKSD